MQPHLNFYDINLSLTTYIRAGHFEHIIKTVKNNLYHLGIFAIQQAEI